MQHQKQRSLESSRHQPPCLLGIVPDTEPKPKITHIRTTFRTSCFSPAQGTLKRQSPTPLEGRESVLVVLLHAPRIHAPALMRIVIVVEAPRIQPAAPARYDRPFDPAPVQRIPIDAREKLVLLHVRDPAGQIPEPLARIDGADGKNQVARRTRGKQLALALALSLPRLPPRVPRPRRRVREHDAALHDLGVDLHRVLVQERRLAEQELVQQDAERPPVDGHAVARVADDLGRQVLRGAAEGVGLALAEPLREAEVHQLQVAGRVEEDVLGLQVTVGDALRFVQELEDQHDLGGVEARGRFGEAPRAPQVREDLAAGTVVEEHVEAVVVREGADQRGDEGVAGDGAERLALVADVFYLLQPDDVDLS